MYRAGAATNESTQKKRYNNGKDEDEDEGGGGEILLGGAETVAQLRLTPAAVSQSAFFDEWSALATAMAVLIANVAVDAVKATALLSSTYSTSSAASPWKGTFYASLWAVLTALYALIKVEVDQARVLSSWAQIKESAIVAAGASGVALFLLLSKFSSSSPSSDFSSPSSPPPLLPPFDLATGGKAAARFLYVATEIEVDAFPRFLVALPLAAVAGVLVPLLAGSAARGARAVSLSATRAPKWGRDMLLARSLADRCALRCAVLVAPLAAALLWVEPCARLWASAASEKRESDDGRAVAVDLLRSLSLVAAALASVLAARPSVSAHCGTALVVWWTRKHGFVSRRRNGGGGGSGGGRGSSGRSGEAALATAAAAAAAARRRAGEVLRLSMQFINLFALKAGVQALAPGLLWLGCGAISLAETVAAAAGGGGSGSGADDTSSSSQRRIALWLGGWSAAAFSLCSLWHLTLHWCGWNTDMPSGGRR